MCHGIKCIINSSCAVLHAAHVFAEFIRQVTHQRREGAQTLCASEKFAVHLLLQNSTRFRVLLHTLSELLKELLHAACSLDGSRVKLNTHLLSHLCSLTRRLDKSGKYSCQLRAHLGSITAHARQRAEGRHQLVHTHAKGGCLRGNTWQGLRQLLKARNTILGRELYLILNGACSLPV